MKQIAYLLDEHVPAAIRTAVKLREPSIDISLVGVDPDVPPKRTPDPELLAFAEVEGLAIVTFDTKTFPAHTYRYLASGRHTWGVFVYPNGRSTTAGRIADDLIYLWSTSKPDEWIDRLEYMTHKA